MLSSRRSVIGCLSAALLLTGSTAGCSDDAPDSQAAADTGGASDDAESARAWIDLAMDLAMDEGLTPLTTARLNGYLGLGLYEAALPAEDADQSLAPAIQGLGDLGERPDELMPRVSMTVTAVAVLREHIPSEAGQDRIRAHAESEAGRLREGRSDRVAASEDWGEHVAEALADRSASDGLEATARPYRVPGGRGHWQPTPPGFMNPFEPYWGDLRRFFGPEHCALEPPPAYDMTPGSAFRKQVDEVWKVAGALDDAGRKTASYWDDQPVFTPTPPGHWVRIANQVAADNDMSLHDTTRLHALLGMALADTSVDIWHWKYHYDLIRPVDTIREAYDPDWLSYITTPPFPEYPSGHSGFSRASATVLEALAPDDGFTDASNEEELGVERSYDSFDQAATEAGLSRVLGGIHFPMGNETGQEVGRCIAEEGLALAGG